MLISHISNFFLFSFFTTLRQEKKRFLCVYLRHYLLKILIAKTVFLVFLSPISFQNSELIYMILFNRLGRTYKRSVLLNYIDNKRMTFHNYVVMKG